jgi:putative ABC transport system ATP-binding protein
MLKIENIKKTFLKGTVNEKQIFNGLNLEVNEGDFVTILGSNGAGKSTLFNVIGGSIPVDDGNLIINKKDFTNCPANKIAKVVGRVHQNPQLGTSPNLTIYENILMYLRKGKKFTLRKLKSGSREQVMKDLSKFELGLEDLLDTQVKFLSGGQRQALTLYLIKRNLPDLLLLDEHTAALDPKTAKKIMDLTCEIVHDCKITTMMITHNLGDAIKYGNRLIMLDKGKVILDIKGEEKDNLTVESLIQMYSSKSSEFDIPDSMILSA